ncbi:hypothetical protein MW932_001585 [Salmonella enterica]|nr:hypothetical protein [Salmonella enterica]EDU1670124.1 hypothetical protein [Salmonella enterica subsp. enterica serovar Oranienburg]EBD4946520.1 hypothetical protein [Salmonella enterica]ECF8302467.1 hypothetical protein [Salmonella enterica]ECR8001597.1 hypothetical protein [Salmonella enterica]
MSSRPRTATVLSGRIAAKTETQHTFVNGTQSVVIFWMYYPFVTRVYCAKQIFPARILAGFYLIIYEYTDMKYLILASALLLTACAGPSGSYWGVTPANSDVCPSGKCQ